MRILAFSDLHCDVATAEALVQESGSADVLVGCGDFATQGRGGEAVVHALAQCPVPVVLVHGNHDDPRALEQCCKGWDHIHLLHGGAVTLGGIDFFGLGGEVPARNPKAWNASETEQKAEELLAGLREPLVREKTVLITHTPPYGIADKQSDGRHEGSQSIRQAIERFGPSLCLCGHIHNAWGVSGVIGATGVHNLGPKANWFTL
ncbi:Ser/Thr protein phosphatase family protein [Roseobacter sp. SK209-2-6]|uniref:metallophosphoesterase family protein n=1 Tax=Roseobacter sp. SK209-2-6 TaxID=388739 RepID=UPI0000F3D340|nr:metallophosphoesterase [Roseobacter sp. SK209-2-6]EBA15073.1 Ser/Thr protein phosphatase family protein [Roseobacter sp. SK209-2-6]